VGFSIGIHGWFEKPLQAARNRELTVLQRPKGAECGLTNSSRSAAESELWVQSPAISSIFFEYY
jgi:hypothetical protein